MRTVLSQSVWTLPPASERNAVTEAIVRVLTEEVENERLNQNSTDSPETSGRVLPAAVHSPAGPQEPRDGIYSPRDFNNRLNLGLK